VSPVPESSPEVYWQDNVLRLSEVSNTSEAAAEAEGDYHVPSADETKKDLSELNRSKIQVVRVELSDERYYLQHAFTKDDEYTLKYAYDHPQSPKLPAEMLLDKKDVDAAYASEAATLAWLTESFFAANPGSRFLSNADLKKMTPPSTGFTVSVASLRTALSEMLNKWGNDTFPPPFLRADGHYLSLADLFQVMTDALAELDRKGKLPDSVSVAQVYGPAYTSAGHGPNVGTVTVASVAHTAAGLTEGLHGTGGNGMPKNTIPAGVTLEGTNINAAQFLRLMAESLVAPSPDTKLRIKMTYTYPLQAQLVPKTRSMGEVGAMWTVKPAQLEIGSLPPSAQPQK
jgi:hypothetical protein